ncbi:MAG: PIN domain-containing protein [Gemmatimonas sp.]
MIVADTGAIIALIDADDAHHEVMVQLFEDDPAAWILPWAILPEVDYLVGRYVGASAADAFHSDLVAGAFTVEWGNESDLRRAQSIREQYADIALGLVDSVVAAVAERLRATAIATVDLRDFGAMTLVGRPKLFPRDHVASGS